MDAELKSTLLEQTRLLKQMAEDIAAIKLVVLREAKPLTDAQKIAQVEAAKRKLQASKGPSGK